MFQTPPVETVHAPSPNFNPYIITNKAATWQPYYIRYNTNYQYLNRLTKSIVYSKSAPMKHGTASFEYEYSYSHWSASTR